MKTATLIGVISIGVALLFVLPVEAKPVEFLSTDTPPYWSAKLPENGLGGSLLHLISAAAGVTYSIKYLPVKRYSTSVAPFIVGDPDLLTNQKDRAIFPIGVFHSAFFFYRPHHELIKVHSIRDMRGHTLGVLRGSIEDKTEFVRSGVKVEENDSVESLLKKLKKGRIDFCILVAGSGRYMIQQLFPDEQENFSQEIIPGLTRPITIMINIHDTEGRVIAQRYRQVLDKTLHSKNYQAVMEGFYGKDFIPADRDAQLDKYIKHYANTWTDKK
jgi:polar amino acid transport system substrate-binding protein